MCETGSGLRQKQLCQLLDSMQDEPLKLQLGALADSALHTFCGFIAGYIKIQQEKELYKVQLEKKKCENCPKLEQQIAVKDSMLQSLGSTVMCLYETKNFYKHMPEVYRILSMDTTTLPTPPLDNAAASEDFQQETVAQMPSKADEIHLRNDTKESKSYIGSPKSKKENASSDISITEESVCEINGTPTGNLSPILGVRKQRIRNGFDALEVQEFTLSPQGKVQKSPRLARSKRTHSKLVQSRLTLQRSKPSRKVDLSISEEFGGGLRTNCENRLNDPRMEHVRGSTEDEDVIMPSPTSEKTSFAFASSSRPTLFKKPAVAVVSSDTTSESLRRVDFDEPMETEIILDEECGEGVNLLRRPEKRKSSSKSPKKPPLTENLNACNVPGECDTNVSMSLLQRLGVGSAGGRAPAGERENLPPAAEQRDKRSPKHASRPSKKSPQQLPEPDNRPTQCDVDNSISLLNNYDLAKVKSEKNNAEQHDAKKQSNQRGGPEQPEFIYKEEVVRKKAEKRLLPGWLCDDCKRFFGDMYKDDHDKLHELQQQCSKHRGRFNPARADTPPGFWDIHFSVPTDTQEFNRQNDAL